MRGEVNGLTRDSHLLGVQDDPLGSHHVWGLHIRCSKVFLVLTPLPAQVASTGYRRNAQTRSGRTSITARRTAIRCVQSTSTASTRTETRWSSRKAYVDVFEVALMHRAQD